MKIRSSQLSAPKGEKVKFRNSPLSLQILIIIVFACVATFLITTKILIPAPGYLSKWAREHGHKATALRDDVRLRQAYLKLPARLMQSLKPSELPKLNIDIKFKHLTKLHAKRAEALAKGILIQGPDDFVPASIRLGERTIKVKLRLKGDWLDHLRGKKWSFRVRVRGKDQVFGMRRFSIQNPKVRGYHTELLFQETLRDLGVLVPRYFFVDVVVNGDDVGIMALEEHFSKELLESNGRRESVIIRFDESLVWAAKFGKHRGFGGPFDSYLNSPIDAFQSSKVNKSDSLSSDYAIAVGMLRGFMNGYIEASDVFDAELFGKYLAVAELWGALHPIRWHNLRLYLNPITLRLEPISFDASVRPTKSKNAIICNREPMISAILKDPKIFKVYRETIQMLAREILDGGRLQEKLEIAEKKNLTDLRKEFYLLEKYPYHKLKTRAKYLLTSSENGFMEDKKPPEGFPTLIHAYTIKDADGPYLELTNAIPHEVEVETVYWIGNGDKPNIEFQPLSEISFPIQLSPTPVGSPPKTYCIKYSPLSDKGYYSLEVSARIKRQKRLYKIIANPYYPALKQNPLPDTNLTEQLSRHPFLSFNVEGNRLVVQPGIWNVDGSLVVPEDITLKVTAGTVLRFSPKEGLFSHGPLDFTGTKNDPIILEGILSENHKNSWGGIAVLDAASPSEWTHVIVRGTTGISRDGWRLTGGVTFYKSEIRMDHCRMQGNRGEDALNIIHSEFELASVEIFETASDAFDADFADGTIKDCIFKNIGIAGGGDAIDISGSEVHVTDSHFLSISDKALSVGEQSKMTASRLIIDNVGTGAASKDGSYLDIKDSTIKDAYYAGLMAYIKKAEFGPGRIKGDKLAFNGTDSEAIVQKGSDIILNGNQIDSVDLDVKELYKTVMKPGLRR
ncbi:MAG: right-handed parallel beta-helix repeat-containing protein [Nitrospinales bacterium]